MTKRSPATMFTDPFRYVPSEDVIMASGKVISYIDNNARELFSEGKMLGVLTVETPSGEATDDNLVHRLEDGRCFIAAFSGTAEGKGCIPYFVPPVFDITEPGGHFREKEAEIVGLSREIDAIESSKAYGRDLQKLKKAEKDKEKETAEFRKRMEVSKRKREEIRAGLSPDDSVAMASLVKESQFGKAELRRLVKRHDEKIAACRESLSAFEASIRGLKSMRQKMSDELQQWIFRQYKVLNARGEEADVTDIFAEHGLVPPGGTGDCAAPKLLQYAFTHGLKPVSMGEFWYGTSPATSVRMHGHFYPSCIHKCGPLLGFMLRGLELRRDDLHEWYREPAIIYEDDAIIVADKPSGMLSAPGLTGEQSLQEYLAKVLRDRAVKDGLPDTGKVLTVHRLDMDTSGVIIYAKTEEAQRSLQRQFEEGTVGKEYRARLCAPENGLSAVHLAAGNKGTVSIPLSPDYEDRPRQKADMVHGKESVTEYEVAAVLPSGETDMIYHPLSGRTHQLRVHSAHPAGLGRPIKGDRLYGGCSDGYDGPLHLEASSVTFIHPVTKEIMTLRSCSKILNGFPLADSRFYY